MATRLNVTGSGRLPLSYPPRAGFEAQLTNSVIPTSSMGAITYTRATIAKVKDNEWVIRNCISGEARFEWARRVQNGLPYSQTLTDASWAKSNSTVTLDTQTINGIPVYRLVNNVTNGVHLISKNSSFSLVAWNKYIISCIAKTGTSQYMQLLVATGASTEYVNFDLSTGTATAWNTTQASSVSLWNGFYRYSLSLTALATGTYGAFYSNIMSPTASRSGSYVWGSEYIYLTALQFEDVTSQSIQTVGEYVSTNVLSSPYHWAYVDWVKYFDTTLTGAAISPTTLKWVVIEWSRTNLLIQSDNLVTSWTIQWATRTANPIATPNGSLSGIKIIPDAGTQVSQTYQSITTSAINYTFSVYAKAGEMSFIQLRADVDISVWYVNFDLVNGTFNAPSTWSGMIEALPNGWYRCMAMTDTVAAVTRSVVITVVSSLTAAHTEAVTGDGTSGLYLWQAQWENGTFASSPITTAAASTTRNADVLSYNVSNVVSAKWAVYLEFTMWDVPSVWVDRRTLALSGNTNNRFQLVATTTTNNNVSVLLWNGSTVISTSMSPAMTSNSYAKIAGKWINGWTSNIFKNGTKSSDLANPQVVVTQIDVGTAGGNAIFGYVKNLKVWKSPPTDSELQALTTL